MSHDAIDVRYVANLARIDLTDEEVTRFQGQLEQVLGYVEQLSKVGVDGVDATSHATPVFDRLREDVARPGIGAEAALSNAPDQALDQIRVPRVIDA